LGKYKNKRKLETFDPEIKPKKQKNITYSSDVEYDNPYHILALSDIREIAKLYELFDNRTVKTVMANMKHYALELAKQTYSKTSTPKQKRSNDELRPFKDDILETQEYNKITESISLEAKNPHKQIGSEDEMKNLFGDEDEMKNLFGDEDEMKNLFGDEDEDEI